MHRSTFVAFSEWTMALVVKLIFQIHTDLGLDLVFGNNEKEIMNLELLQAILWAGVCTTGLQ